MFPLRKVVLFKHGVGYFERQKQVEGDVSVDFFFKAEQMNDVLKSLTAVDLGGGSISSISYQTQTPVEKQLEQLSLHLTKDGTGSLTELLKQTIGASVIITTSDDQKVTGKVLGMDSVIEQDPEWKEKTREVKRLHLLVDGSAIRTFPVLDLRNFVFKDPALRQDLQHLLNIMLDMKKKDLKKVTLFSKGTGKRMISAAYVVESSVWKTSYRLKLSEDKKKPHRLEGWCLVDNTGDEDWSGVKLTLVGGRPNAFTLDLYTPRFRKRPVIAVQDDPEPNQPELIDVLPHHGESYLKECPPTLSSLDAGPQIGRVKEDKTATDKSKAIESWKETKKEPPKKSMENLRQVKPVDVFQYDIDKPVSVKRGQSALVPFLNEEFQGQPCALFNESLNKENPMSVILFKNTFKVTLDSGPITIFDEDKCIGEAMVDSIPDGETKFIAYGIERHIAVTQEFKQEYQPYHEAELKDGNLRLTRYRRDIRTYKFNHTGSIDLASLYLEHRYQKGEYSLVDTPTPVSKTENFYRFFLQAKAGEITTYTIQEHMLVHESQGLYRIYSGTANSWLSAGYIDKKTFEIIANELIPLQDRIDKEAKELEKENTELRTAQSKQNSAYSTVYNVTSSSYNRTVDMSLMMRVKEMLETEDTIRKFRTKVNDRRLVERQLNAELNSKRLNLYCKMQIAIKKP